MYKRKPVAGVPAALIKGFVDMTAGMSYRPQLIYEKTFENMSMYGDVSPALRKDLEKRQVL